MMRIEKLIFICNIFNWVNMYVIYILLFLYNKGKSCGNLGLGNIVIMFLLFVVCGRWYMWYVYFIFLNLWNKKMSDKK